MKVALTIPTGRPSVKKVVKAFIENAIIYGYDPKDFSVYLSIDREYQNTVHSDFKIDPRIERKLNKVFYISNKRREEFGKKIAKRLGIPFKIAEDLFIGRGYSKQRNVALLMALGDGNDFAICIDDDEAPFIPIKKESGKVYWKNLDFFTPHIKALASGADITRGPYMGYQSPIPSDFDRDVPEEIRKKLGEALMWGSDVITEYTFFNLMSQIKYLSEKDLEDMKPVVVKNGINGKHVYAGNMGINLNSVRNGKIPIFYTPPSARGEDTIFALQLKKARVLEVKSFIFHDPFQIYPEIFEKKFPEELKRIPITHNSKERFSNALIGWLKYAPLLIEMTSKNAEQKERKISEMVDKIGEPTCEIASLLDLPELLESESILRKYHEEVKLHKKGLIKAQKEWQEKIVPSLA